MKVVFKYNKCVLVMSFSYDNELDYFWGVLHPNTTATTTNTSSKLSRNIIKITSFASRHRQKQQCKKLWKFSNGNTAQSR